MNLLDLFKKKPETAKQQPPLAEVGVTGSLLYTNKDFQSYNPDLLMINKGSGIYKKMLADDQVKAVMSFKRAAVISRGYYFDSSDDDEESKKQAEIFQVILDKIEGSWVDKLKEILSALKYGFSVCEKVYKTIEYDGKSYWGIKDIKSRPFYTFDGGFITDKHGNLEKLQQIIDATKIEIPVSKVIHFAYQPDVNRWYGESDLNSAYKAWWAKDLAQKFENVHLERHAHGFIWASIDTEKGGLLPADVTRLQNMLDNISVQSSMRVPSAVSLNAIQPMRTDAYDRAIARQDKAISKSILVPNLLGLSEQGNTGSYAQSETQLEAFLWVLDEIAKSLEETLNEQLFKELSEWNFGTPDFPRFKFEPISESKKNEIVKQWNELVKGGSVTKSDTDEAHVRNLIGFPEKDEAAEEPDNQPVDIPDLEDWATEKENNSFIRKQFAEKPWMRRVNFKKIEGHFDSKEEKLSSAIGVILVQAKGAIEKQVINLVGDRSLGNLKPAEIESVTFPKSKISELRKTIRTILTEVLNSSYDAARRELPRRKFKIISPGMDKTQTERYLASKSMRIAGNISKEVLDSVQQVLINGIKYDHSLKTILQNIEEDTKLSSMLPDEDAKGRPVNKPARIENIARTNVADAVNQARMSLFGDPELKGFVLAYEYSAILDSRTTEICEHLDGRIRRDFGIYQPPNHYQCRSILIPVTSVDKELGDWDGQQSPAPSKEPMAGFK